MIAVALQSPVAFALLSYGLPLSPAQYEVAVAQVDVDMAVMAITTLEANMIRLIQENLDVSARPAAEAAVRERLSELLIRLKDRNNYDGQAGRNLYEDVSPVANKPDNACLHKSLLGDESARLVEVLQLLFLLSV